VLDGGLNVLLQVKLSSTGLALTILQDFWSIKFQNIDLFTKVSYRILNNMDSIDIFLLIVNVYLHKQSVLLLLICKCNSLISCCFMLAANINRSSNIEDALVLRLFSGCSRNIVLDLVNFIFLNVAIKEQSRVVLIVISNGGKLRLLLLGLLGQLLQILDQVIELGHLDISLNNI
jgi:hypothetical protein